MKVRNFVVILACLAAWAGVREVASHSVHPLPAETAPVGRSAAPPGTTATNATTAKSSMHVHGLHGNGMRRHRMFRIYTNTTMKDSQ